MTTPPDPAAWLEHEHDAERDARRDRLQWIIDSYPESAFGFLLGGGWLSKQLLEEAKYCFVYGQYVATAVLGFALVERLLASEFYAAGRDDLEGATSVNLLREAHLAGRLTAEEYEVFDKLRLLRNPFLHFRRPLAAGSLEHRWSTDGNEPWQLIEEDARRVLSGLFHLLAKHAV